MSVRPMKWLGVIVLIGILAFAATVHAETPVVKTSIGSMSIFGNFQAGFNYYIGDEVLGSVTDTKGNAAPGAVDRGKDLEFRLRLIRFGFKGFILQDKITYFLQIEGNSNEAVQLRDAQLGFKYIPYTTFLIGRYLPHFQYWTPIHTGKTFFVEYPMMNQFFGIQRHTGFDIAFNHKYVDAYLGVYNGHDFRNMAAVLNPTDRVDANGDALGLGNPAWNTDENTAKDIYFSVDGKPIKGLDIWAGVWYGTPLDYYENDEGELIAHNATITAFDAGAGYVADWGLRIWAEFFMSQLSYDSAYFNNGSKEDRADDTYELNSMSYYVRLGYNIKSVSGVPLEFLVQYDYLDPDTLNDEEKHGADDERTEITGGVNYYIQDYNAMIYLNYIAKMEAYKDLLNKAGDDVQDGLDNDEIRVLFQVSF